MKYRKLALTIACCGLFALPALGQGLRQPASVQSAALRSYYTQPEQPAQPSPSDLPAAPPVAEPQLPLGFEADYAKPYGVKSKAMCGDRAFEPWRLFPELPHGITVTGWLEAGATASADSPADRFVSPVGFNDRHELQMNQFYTVIERPIDTSCRVFDVGGRVDVLYGTDARFTEVPGLELNRDGTDSWNTQRFYRLSMPQMYAEIGLCDLSVKVGHWYTTIGHEVVTAPDNFFYSHAYSRLYAQPFTHTGVLLSYDASEQLAVHAGIHNGWDNFDSVDSRAGVLTGASWTTDTMGLAFTITSGDEINNRGYFSNRTMYSLVYSRHVTEHFDYILQHDQGWQVDDGGPDTHAEWYGINQHLLYTLNDCWRMGGRFEWFRDDDGTRVTGADGNFYEISLGINWTPKTNFIMRPEVRWDWFDGNGLPYDGGTKDNQFTVAFDTILLY